MQPMQPLGSAGQRLLLIEFNELCPSLLDRFMNEGALPNFRRLYEGSVIYTTDAEEQEPNLEPWIQWPTVHSGLPYGEHRLFHLGDGHRLEHKCIAELISDAGIRVGVFGSMNLNYRSLNGYLLPDPWSKEPTVQPVWLEPFYRTVARQVQEASRAGGWSKSEAAQFGWFLMRNGLSWSTARALVRQCWQDRKQPSLKWRRAALLDLIQYDVFRKLNRRFGIRFATFFCNSTAHFQHYYWRNWEPEHFAEAPSQRDHESLKRAVQYGYKCMDRIIGRLLRDYPDAVLVLCTALSQSPWTATTKCTFRPRNFAKLLDFAGISVEPSAVKPVMAEQFHLQCDRALGDRAVRQLRELAVDGDALLHIRREGDGLFIGCRLNDPAVLNRKVRRGGDGATCDFESLFYMIHGMRSGHHHPDGALWIRTGRHRVVEEKVPLTVVAPTILSFFGLTPPESMRAEALQFVEDELPRMSSAV